MGSASLRRWRDRLPSRVVVAWAVLGAAGATCLMYSKAVFHGEAKDWLTILSETFPGMMFDGWWPHDSRGRVEVAGQLVYEGSGPPGEPERIVGEWHLGVASVLGLLGAVGGIIAHRLLRRPTTKAVGRDIRLWLLFSVVVFFGLAWAGIPGESRTLWSTARFVYQVSPAWAADDFDWLGPATVRSAVIALVVSWAAHVIAVAAGCRWFSGPGPDQAADYDDARPANPACP
jgi:hypothetical protein